MVREVASKTSDVAGDGTTTATLLAQAIYREGVKNVAAGVWPEAIRRGIERAVGVMVESLHAQSQPVTGGMIAQVGAISANHDETILLYDKKLSSFKHLLPVLEQVATEGRRS